MDAEDRFELPRKFQAGVIRRERCAPGAVLALRAASTADQDAWETPGWQSVDLIVAQRGVAAAVHEFAAFSASDRDFSKPTWYRGSSYESRLNDTRWSPMLRLLDLVRSASDEEYAEAMATTEKMRAEYPALAARAAMAVLALDQPQWCSADIADYSADDDEHQHVARLLMVATTTREQARELGSRIRGWQWVNDDRRAEGTFLATVEGGADEFLIGCVEGSRWHAFNLLPKLPTDRAVKALIDELGPRDAQAALLEAAKRFPRRVLRLLAEEGPATQVDYVLRMHVAANGEIASSELATLSAVARARVAALLPASGASGGDGAAAAIPVAAEADLPRVLVVPPWKDPDLGRPAALKNLPAPVPYFRWPARNSRRSMDVPEPAPSAEQAGDQAEIMNAMAMWLNSERKEYSDAAVAFYRRHAAEAVRQTLPRALGPLGPERKAAEVAIRFVAREGLTDVLAVAAEFGPDAEREARALLDRRGLEAFPKSMPQVPLWADPATLPRLLLADGKTALPASAVGVVVQMLTISSRREIAPYGGIADVKEACDAASLAEFAWGLFENWGRTGYLTKNLGWAWDAMLWFGDEETARRLAPLVRAWPGQGGAARAVTALDFLIAIGGEAGLREVYDISQRSPFAALRAEAGRRIADVAEARGLSADELEDQLVLDLGVGPDGTSPLDYGARRFTVAFDDFLLPYLTDSAGKRRGSPPKPGAKDDAELAAASQQRFAELKKDAKTFAMRQAERLEAAMVAGRTWPGPEFQRLFVEHPLLRAFARRLVWAEYDGAGALRATFRFAEDGTLADVADERHELSPDLAGEAGAGFIGLPHPLLLGPELPRWAEICHDYEIIQPFPQVGRPTFALTEAERGALRLDRFCGVELPTDRFLALSRSPGWGGVGEWNAGSIAGTGRQLSEDRLLIVRISPGYREGRLADTPDQTITDVWICPTDGSGRRAGRTEGLPFGVLDAVRASEILADLTAATGG